MPEPFATSSSSPSEAVDPAPLVESDFSDPEPREVSTHSMIVDDFVEAARVLDVSAQVRRFPLESASSLRGTERSNSTRPNPPRQSNRRNDMPGYSLEDFQSMLYGSVVRELQGNRICKVREIARDGSGGFSIHLQTLIGSSNLVRRWEGDAITTVINWDRPRARMCYFANRFYVVRPQVRRSRHKGLCSEEYVVIKLSEESNTVPLNRVDGATWIGIIHQLYGEPYAPATNIPVFANGSMAIVPFVRSGNLPALVPDTGVVLGEQASYVLQSIAARMQYNEFYVNEAITEDTAAQLAHIFGIATPTTRLMWFESHIGDVVGNTIQLFESADLLASAVRSSFPEKEVENVSGR